MSLSAAATDLQRLLQFNHQVLAQAQALLVAHEDASATAYDGPVGAHLRHVIECYEALLLPYCRQHGIAIDAMFGKAPATVAFERHAEGIASPTAVCAAASVQSSKEAECLPPPPTSRQQESAVAC